MAKNRLSSADGPGFLRACTDNWRDFELDYGVFITMRVQPSAQKGVLEHRISAWHEGERRGTTPAAAYTATFPTPMVQTYEAFMFQCLVRLGRILEQQRLFPEGKA